MLCKETQNQLPSQHRSHTYLQYPDPIQRTRKGSCPCRSVRRKPYRQFLLHSSNPLESSYTALVHSLQAYL